MSLRFQLVSRLLPMHNSKFIITFLIKVAYQSVAHKATLHLTNGKEVPVERSKTEISHLTKRLRLFLQDEKVTREVIPQKSQLILGGRFQTSSEATEFQKKQCPCGKLGVKKCSRCHTQYYCDTSCQRKDWSKHKVNCVE